ncbi:MAG: ABC transporter substrate-binding protein [Solirubrobacterales bacterium]|nr:ABC transporter substrate-binding protein [Solirubrobacterales bacterium]
MRTLTIAGATVALALAGCGGADESEPAADGGTDAGASGGAPPNAPGFDGTTIKVGALSPLSGPVAVIGNPLTNGNKVFFDALNAKGGIAGKYKVELVQDDTQYKPDVAVQRYNRLKGDVVAFTQVLGTAVTLGVLPQLKRDEILAAPASLDAFWVREPNLLPVGNPYQGQAINGIDYYLKNGGEGKNICSLSQDDAYGEAGKEGVDFVAEKEGFKLASAQKFTQGDKDVTGQIQSLAGAKCDAVFVTSLPTDSGTIWGTAAKLGFAPQWIAQSPAWIDELGASPLKDYLAKNVWVVAEGTEWGDESVEGMKQMVADVEQFDPNQDPDYYFAFGYVQGEAMSAVLEKAVENGDLSHKGVLDASKELGNVSFDGLFGDYEYGDAEARTPPSASTIFEVDTDKPYALGTLEKDYTSEAVSEFEYKAR